METDKNLAELGRDISGKLLTSKILLEILQDMVADDIKIGTLVDIVLNDITEAFNDISTCRRKIFILD